MREAIQQNYGGGNEAMFDECTLVRNERLYTGERTNVCTRDLERNELVIETKSEHGISTSYDATEIHEKI